MREALARRLAFLGHIAEHGRVALLLDAFAAAIVAWSWTSLALFAAGWLLGAQAGAYAQERAGLDDRLRALERVYGRGAS